MSPRREFYEGKEGGNKTEGKADWRLLITRPPAGAREVWGKERGGELALVLALQSGPRR